MLVTGNLLYKLLQDSDWEEVENGDGIEKEQGFLSSVSAAASGKPTYEHLEAIAKAFNEVWLWLTFHNLLV